MFSRQVSSVEPIYWKGKNTNVNKVVNKWVGYDMRMISRLFNKCLLGSNLSQDNKSFVVLCHKVAILKDIITFLWLNEDSMVVKGKDQNVFVACRAFLWSLSCLALFKMLFTSGALDRLLFQMQNVICSSGMHRKPDFAFQYFDVCGFGCVKKVNPLCIKFDISSCFAYKMKKYHLLKRFSTNFHIFLSLKTVNQTHSYYLPTCFMSSYGVVFFFVSCVVCD